jgi:hypothetical protein
VNEITTPAEQGVVTNGGHAGVARPDLVALGLGGTSMMAMLWTVAMGRKAIGVELRGDPFLGVHWNIREDLFHQLGLIDAMMLERYGEDGVPVRANGKSFVLADCFYSPDTAGGDIVADEIIDGFDTEQHIVGTINNVEFIDDRWRDRVPNRIITVLDPPPAPAKPDPARIRDSVADVLDGPSTFQAEAASVQKLLRRYLELIEGQDHAAGREPRVQLFTHHRAAADEDGGLEVESDGRVHIRIEELQEFDFKGKFVRVRKPGTTVIDLGVPELLLVAEGANSTDANRLGFEQKDVEVDHGDGRGPVVAQADFLAGLVEVHVGDRLRRRISSEFDANGNEYWVRQIAVGHENDPEVGWVLVQVPDFKTFDPIEAGLVPADTETDSPEFFAFYQHMLYEYYIKQAADVLEIDRGELAKAQMLYGPKLFSLVERIGEDPLVAANAVIAGDSFGNGHFLTSGGANTGLVGHGARVLEYWRARDSGSEPVAAIRGLADRIREDTHAWLHVSAMEFSEAAPINFGADRIEQLRREGALETNGRAAAVATARRQRHELIPIDPSDWRRVFVHNGKVISELPELGADHPLQRPERAATLLGVLKSLPEEPGQANSLLVPPRTVTQLISAAALADAPTTARCVPAVGVVEPQRATMQAALEVIADGLVARQFTLDGTEVLIGRADPDEELSPQVDLTEYDPGASVSRRHAMLRSGDGGVTLEDLGSRNATRLDGTPLTPGEPQALHDSSLISFGAVHAVFRKFGASELPPAFSAP